jgi:hypothetical protein
MAVAIPMLPTFLVIGAQKSGSTALHAYLRRHPDVAMSNPKELKFFVERFNWNLGVAWYEEQFAPAAARPVPPIAVGETSPDYARCTIHPGVPERIASVIPDVRLIYIVRHPLERIRSAYQHAIAHGAESRPIDEAVQRSPHYVDDTRYAMQVDRFLEVFDREQLLLVGNRALRDDRRATLRQVGAFIGVDPDAFEWSRVGSERYTSEDRTAPAGVVAVASRSRLAPMVRSVVPASLRQRVWRASSREIGEEELTLSHESVRHIMGALADDIRRIAADVPEAATWTEGGAGAAG